MKFNCVSVLHFPIVRQIYALCYNLFLGLSPRTPVYRVLFKWTYFSKYSKVIHGHVIKCYWLSQVIHNPNLHIWSCRFFRLEIFVKHRSLYDSLYLSVAPAEFSQLQCFSSKIIVFSRALGLCRIIDNSDFLITRLSTYHLLQVTSDNGPDM